MRLYRIYQAITEQRPKVDPMDILVLIIGNSVTALWLYLIATRGAIFPQISPTVQVVSLSFFELLTLLTALDLIETLKSNRWGRFLVLGGLVWIVPVLFTVQVMQLWKGWIPFWMYLTAQGVLFLVYMGFRRRSELPGYGVMRWVVLVVLVVALVGANQAFGLIDRVLALGQAEVTKLRAQADRHVEQGERLFERRDYVLAKEQFEKAVAQYPAHGAAQAYLGIIYSKLGFYEEAVEAFHKVQMLEDTGRSRVNLGLAYYQAGNVKGAVQAWSQVPVSSSLRAEAEDLIEIARKQNKGQDLNRWIAPVR